MTVTAENQVPILGIWAEWEGEIPGSQLHMGCEVLGPGLPPPDVVTAVRVPIETREDGAQTCTVSTAIQAKHYSGSYTLKSVSLNGSEPYPWGSSYSGDGKVWGHGQGGVFGEHATTCCHTVDIPDFVVQ